MSGEVPSAMTDTDSPLHGERWIRRWLPDLTSWQTLCGDLSARCYYRLDLGEGRSAVFARYPTDQHDVLNRFVTTGRLLRDAGISVPSILAVSPPDGYMLLEDGGRETVFEYAATGKDASPWIRRAATLLPPLQSIVLPDLWPLPPLGAAALDAELDEAWDRFLAVEGLGGGDATRAALSDLCRHLESDGMVPCHRDFMARNLLLGTSAEDPVTLRMLVIDHQDLRLGPRYYDLASLLNDSLAAEEGLEAELLARFAPSPEDRTQYHRAVVQRGLKAIATFRRFAARGKGQHLPLVLPTARRVWRSLEHVPECAALRVSLSPAWMRYFEGH